MSEFTTAKGIYNGWYYRFVGLAVLAIAVLQVVAFYAFHYPISVSVALAVVVMSYVVAPRVKERRLANAIAGVIALFVIDVILELTVEKYLSHSSVTLFLYNNAIALVMGIVLAFLYLKMTQWSEKKRVEVEEKRRSKLAAERTVPVRRHHAKKKRKK